MYQVTISTQDHKRLSAELEGEEEKCIILVHELGLDKHSFDFELPGFSIMRFDLRGHGESDGDWHEMTNYDSMVLDLYAVEEYLRSVHKFPYAIIGFQIGADIAIKAVPMIDVKRLILLSPSEDFKGFSGQTLVITSEHDPNKAKIENVDIKVYPGDATGMGLLEQGSCKELIQKWLKGEIEK